MGAHFLSPNPCSFPKAPGVSSTCIRHVHRLALYILSSWQPMLHSDSMEMAELCLSREKYMGTRFQHPVPSPKDPGVSTSRTRHARRLALHILSSLSLRPLAGSVEMAELCLSRV